MAYSNSKSVRFHDDVEFGKLQMANGENMYKVQYKIDGRRVPESSSKKVEKLSRKGGTSLKAKELSRVFSEDYERVKKKILDPLGHTIRRWNKIFFAEE